jgi:hypothetical protein
MSANVGDWLIVKSNTENRHARRGVILSVHEGGTPPYRVRWVDEDREVVFFPGPDAEVITPEQLAALDRAQLDRIAAVQSRISAKKA